MENNIKKRTIKRARRVLRVRKNVRGSAEKPRLCVVKSNKHITAQLIDDDKGITLASVSTLSKDMKAKDFRPRSKEAAKVLGTLLAHKALEKQVKAVVFDRGRFKFHGIIAELAGAARAAGLQF